MADARNAFADPKMRAKLASEMTHTNAFALSPRQRANLSAIGNAFLSVVPVVGDVIDAKEGYETLTRAGDDFERGDYVSGIGNTLSGAAIGASAALPFIGLGGITRAVRNASDAVDLGRAEQKGITAYHGSPHDFDKFDLSKIGTGEGAQVYGHGAYLAESEEVGRAYRDKLSADRRIDVSRGLAKYHGDVDAAIDGTRAEIKRLGELQLTPESGAAKRDELIISSEERLVGLIRQKTISDANSRMKELADEFYGGELGSSIQGQYRKFRTETGREAAIEYDNLMDARGRLPSDQGHMYEVRIDADENDFLDWDAPLSEQTPGIQAIANKYNVGRSASGLKENTGAGIYRGIGGAEFQALNTLTATAAIIRHFCRII